VDDAIKAELAVIARRRAEALDLLVHALRNIAALDYRVDVLLDRENERAKVTA
jgi:hypothetical protein